MSQKACLLIREHPENTLGFSPTRIPAGCYPIGIGTTMHEVSMVRMAEMQLVSPLTGPPATAPFAGPPVVDQNSTQHSRVWIAAFLLK